MDMRTPWYQYTRRWGQTNLNELDPLDYDAAWWRDYWRRTAVQGVIVNAGGIVAFYPSRFALHYRAASLGDRDLFGEIVALARAEGLTVLARMDSNRADERFYRMHPDWFVVDTNGEPCRVDDHYLTCVNSDYYKVYLPNVLEEIIDFYSPDGFADNSWTGVGRHVICQCETCQRKFRDETGYTLPTVANWYDPAYRQWIKWSYRCRLENWDLNNRVTQARGGPDCLWLGMVNGNPIRPHTAFCDLKEIAARSPVLMSDQQSRDEWTGFEQNGLSGKLLHGVLGWDKLIPESMATYVRGEHTFRKAANPPLETRFWMIEGFAGGVSPWWHHIGARQDDRRQFRTVEPLMRWHADNEAYLYDREPVANVGLLWSQENLDFYGRNEVRERVQLPWRGFVVALTRARIPYLPVHADHVARDANRFAVLILPDLGVLTDAQAAAIHAFVANGGSLVVTGRSGCFDVWGDPRPTPALDDLLGVYRTDKRFGVEGEHTSSWDIYTAHTYLRLLPELNQVGAPPADETRHPILNGLDETDIVAFGGTLEGVAPEVSVNVLATYIPPFPIYPPEFSWMRETHTNIPAILIREHPAGGRIVYLAADLDRCYGRQYLPDHGNLLANAVRWAAHDTLPLTVTGPGYLDCHLYCQPERIVLHIVNLSASRAWPGYVEETLPVGPVHIALRLTDDFTPQNVALQVGAQILPVHCADGWANVELPTIVDHELLIFS
ncbi:MAG TPA: beta-galactosidase trimerization domain-containing protein [Anaerolineae bacterium]|nr:beta-galactosidase trimerization domain-containing protein [Anaerolineae bacterium]